VRLLPYAGAATASNSIHKVILASSIVSIMWDWWERGPDYLYSGATLTQQRGGALLAVSMQGFVTVHHQRLRRFSCVFISTRRACICTQTYHEHPECSLQADATVQPAGCWGGCLSNWEMGALPCLT
jgi:hypothetical protein